MQDITCLINRRAFWYFEDYIVLILRIAYLQERELANCGRLWEDWSAVFQQPAW